jgi:hypothetical protein
MVRVWFAVDVSLRNSPPMAAFRQMHTLTSDAYFYRVYEFCKLYARQGSLAGQWPAVAGFVAWPESWESLRKLWRECGLVFGEDDEVYQWMGTNGYLLARQETEAKRARQNRRAARIGAKKRRRAKAAQETKRRAGCTKAGG